MTAAPRTTPRTLPRSALLATLLLPLLLGFGSGSSPGAVGGTERGAGEISPNQPPPSDPGLRVGSVQGEIVMGAAPARRVAEHYPGAGGGASHQQRPIPALAVLEGPGAPVLARGGTSPRLVQRDTAFVPGLVVIPVGGTVAFPNEDPFFHNVFSYSRPKRFDLGRFPRGESRSVTFDQPGYAKILCEVHSWMRGAVAVVESSLYAIADAQGRFTIANVPAGRYTLVVTDFDKGVREIPVTVTDGAVARVRVEF